MGGFLTYQHTRIFNAAAPGQATGVGKPIHKTLFNGASSITPRRPGSALRITFSFAGDTTLSHRIVSAGTTADLLLNDGNAFSGGKEYSREVPTFSTAKSSAVAAEADATHDFIQGTDVAVTMFLVEEIQEAVS